ncbi:TraR/DksA C4-type zinc finger protein [Paenibacillus sp. CC-CFT747]|nr:TraR/DksA C4-type zinc finger protein [Paenibacillus sp. CC-CFT747]
MSHLTKDQWNTLNKLLVDEQKELEKHFEGEAPEAQNASLRDSVGELTSVDNHPADVGTEVFERSRDLAVDETMSNQLDEVNQALKRMDSGEYGTCLECGKDIPYERLEAIPYTAYCVDHTPAQNTSDNRPVEEEVLEPGRGATDPNSLTEQNRLDDSNAWDMVESYGNSDSPPWRITPMTSTTAIRTTRKKTPMAP